MKDQEPKSDWVWWLDIEISIAEILLVTFVAGCVIIVVGLLDWRFLLAVPIVAFIGILVAALAGLRFGVVAERIEDDDDGL